MKVMHSPYRPAALTALRAPAGRLGMRQRAPVVLAGALLALLALAPAHAGAQQMVVYTWTTDSLIVGNSQTVPTVASFEVPLGVAQTGSFGQLDISDIQLAFPGINPLSFTTGSSIGLDNTAYVDPTTLQPIYRDSNPGLAVIGYQGALYSSTFLSLTFDNANPGTTVVADQFNAINGGPGSLGYGNGHWVASVTAVPEPGTLATMAAGLLLLVGVLRRQRPSGLFSRNRLSGSGR